MKTVVIPLIIDFVFLFLLVVGFIYHCYRNSKRNRISGSRYLKMYM